MTIRNLFIIAASLAAVSVAACSPAPETATEDKMAPAVEGAMAPAEGAMAPADGAMAPADVAMAPADEAMAPAEDPMAPADGAMAPADKMAPGQ